MLKASAPLVIILVAVVSLFTGAFLDGVVSPHSFAVANVIVNWSNFDDTLSLVKSALLFDGGQAIIDSANVEFTIEAFEVEGSHFVNVVSECIFTSDDVIDGTFLSGTADDGVCIVCRFIENGEVLAEGKVDLPLGYTQTSIPSVGSPVVIPMIEDPNEPEANDIHWLQTVQIALQSAILDFNGLSNGFVFVTDPNNPDQPYKDKYGIEIFGHKKVGIDNQDNFIVEKLDLMVFNSDLSGTADPDLEVDIGNILIIPHDDNDDNIPDNPSNPNDSPNGGWQIFHFDPPRFINSFVFVDADRNNQLGMDVATAWDGFDSNTNDCSGNLLAGPIQIQNAGDGSKQVLVMMNIEKTVCLKVQYMDSGAVGPINLGCPLSSDFIDNTPLPLGNNPVQIFYTEFDEFEEEENNWTYDHPDPDNDGILDPNSRSKTSHSTRVDFGLFNEGYLSPISHSPNRYLGGGGNIDDLDDVDGDGVELKAWAAFDRDSIDISLYQDIVLDFWFSYEDTESADEFGLYYFDGVSWQPIYENFSPTGGGNQAPWTHIFFNNFPPGLSDLELQFRYETSSSSEHIMIDDLQVTGIPI